MLVFPAFSNLPIAHADTQSSPNTSDSYNAGWLSDTITTNIVCKPENTVRNVT